MRLKTTSELNEINTKMEALSTKIIARANEITRDVITIRNDPLIPDLWHTLCRHHRKAMLLCAGITGNKPEICTVLEKPQACVEALRLSEEEVCCEVFKRRLRSEKPEKNKVRYLMSSPVITTSQKATVSEITKLMKKHGIGSLVVVDKREIKGIVTEHDLISKVYSILRDPRDTLAHKIMTKSPIFTVKPEANIKEAIKIMSKHNIKHLPIIDNGNLVGMLAVPDFYRE